MSVVRSFLLITCLLATAAATALAAPEQSPIKFENAVNKNLGVPNFNYPNSVDLKLTTTWKAATGVLPTDKPEKKKIEGTLPNHMATVTFKNATYNLSELHLHHRQEHVLGTNDYPLELHLVHERTVGGKKEHLAVGLWIEPTISMGNENEALKQMLANLPAGPAAIGNADQMATFANFKLPDLLLTDRNKFFRYDGSLTTFATNAEKDANMGRGVSETAVQWIMFKDPLKLTQEKINMFAAHPAMTGARTPPFDKKAAHNLEMHMVPEPSTVWLLAVAGLAAAKRRRRR